MKKEPVTSQPTVPPPNYDQGYAHPGYLPQPGYAPQQAYPQHLNQTTTNVVVVQQQPTNTTPQYRNWSTGICGCFEDCGSLCMALCCPGILMLTISQRMDEGCCYVCCCPGALLGLRIKLRVENHIKGSLLNDYCAVQCCSLCAMCQLSRELEHIGR